MPMGVVTQERAQGRKQLFTLYRFYTSGGALLYVGMTVNPGGRLSAHKREKTWWNEVARIDLEQFDSDADLRQAEARAIRTEGPIHNIAGDPGGETPKLFGPWSRTQTHCKHGHDITRPGSYKLTIDGIRRCLRCRP